MRRRRANWGRYGHFGVYWGILWCVGCQKPSPPAEPQNPERYAAGGVMTVYDYHTNAFSSPPDFLAGKDLERHMQGDLAFERTFVTWPSEGVGGGLGPLYNQTSCRNCHIRDGRAEPPAPGQRLSRSLNGLLFRLSLPGADERGAPLPVPGFGRQLQTRSLYGGTPEGDVAIGYEEQTYVFPDGESYTLRKPVYQIVSPYREWPADAQMSPRIAPPVFGLGLLEAVSDETIRALADENDADNDGISGKANEVWDEVMRSYRLGRFGWKAGQPDLYHQTAAAYNHDMGVTNPLFPVEHCDGQSNCVGGRHAGVDIGDDELQKNVFYLQSLAVPAPTKINDPVVQKGETLFLRIGCGKCHVPKLTTAHHAHFPAASGQTIFPFTDLLLHDMGEGLADGRGEFRAHGREWRTPPLWGIGKTELVNGHTHFLHDGRARNLMEAILWHGGEAEGVVNAFRRLSREERAAVVAFLESL